LNAPLAPWVTYDQALSFLTSRAEKLDAATLVMRLRKAFPGADVTELNLAVETHLARRTAAEKLGEWAKEGHFSVSLLQQASRSSIAEYRAQYFKGCDHVLEIGTGTGSDTAALARVARHVTTIDSDPAASELARRNLSLLGISNVSFLVGEASETVVGSSSDFDGFFADPMRRRSAGERVRDGEDYSPPLSRLYNLTSAPLRAIKVSPGLFVEPCPEGWIRQFVGYGEECLEQTLWFGSSIADSSVVVTDCGERWAPSSIADKAGFAETLTGFIVEAHGVVNRSQHLDLFFRDRGVRLFSPEVAYGVTDTPPSPSKLLTTYRILEDLPYSLRKLRAALAARGWSSRTEFKKRAFSGDLEAIRAELDLPAHSHAAPFGTVFLFRYHGKPWALLAERVYE